MTIYQTYEIRYDYVEIKFDDSLNISTLINNNFTVKDVTGATPITIANPFKAINVTRDFYSITRVLKLWWNFALTTNTNYEITIANLQTLSGTILPNEIIAFSTDGVELPPTSTQIEEPPTREPVEVEDYSIKTVTEVLFTDISASTVDIFKIESIKPDNFNAAYLTADYNEGRIEIIFNAIPAANYISSEFFKVQRKLIGKGISRWEDVNVIVGSDPATKMVVIYMPSDDAITQYAEPYKNYWLPGYKYRLRISENIGSTVNS